MTNETVMPVMRALEALYEDATTERERDAIRRCMGYDLIWLKKM